MTVIDMGMPSDLTAGIGHNSRMAAEIQQQPSKEALEAKAQYIRDNLREGVSNKVKILYTASISPSLSAEAFRQLFVTLSFANRSCDNIGVGLKRVAMLLERSERSIQRVAKELEELGWLSEPKRQGRAPSVRGASIPKHALNAIIFEILDKTDLSGRTEVPDLALRKSDTTKVAYREDSSTISNGQTCPADTPDLATEPYIEPYVVVELPARAEASALVVEDYTEYHELFKAWGRKPNQFFDTFGGRPITPEMTASNLNGAVRALTQFPQEIRIEAARMTIVSMQARTMMDSSKQGPSGFANYFQQEMRGYAALLIERKNNPPAEVARGSPPPHWRDEERQKTRQTADKMEKFRAQYREKKDG